MPLSTLFPQTQRMSLEGSGSDFFCVELLFFFPDPDLEPYWTVLLEYKLLVWQLRSLRRSSRPRGRGRGGLPSSSASRAAPRCESRGVRLRPPCAQDYSWIQRQGSELRALGRRRELLPRSLATLSWTKNRDILKLSPKEPLQAHAELLALVGKNNWSDTQRGGGPSVTVRLFTLGLQCNRGQTCIPFLTDPEA